MKSCPRCGNSTLRKLVNLTNPKTVAYICPCGYESVRYFSWFKNLIWGEIKK